MKVKLLVIKGALCFMLLLCPALSTKLLAQSDSAAIKKTITGKITDADGKPLDGATVQVKGTSLMVATKPGGEFTLRDVPSDAVLIVTVVGYESQEAAINGQSVVSVSMKTKTNALEDVVVVGYGTRKKTDVTGAVASLGAEEIKKRPVQNALQAMQGKVPGVDITSNERPGEVGKVLIRGSRSLSATSDPLYVVDGIPMPLGSAGGIEAINPQDIEAIDVLKDASATAIYGSRGANGVILVTTKQGKKGKTTLNYAGSVTLDNQQNRTEMMNSGEYIEFRRAAYRRAGNYPDVPTLTDDNRIFGGDYYAFENVKKGWATGTWNASAVPTTDWTGLVLRTGVMQDHTLSVSGGNEKMKTYASVGFQNQQGTMKGQDYKRYTGKFTTEVKPIKWFTMGGSITATYSKQNYGFSSLANSSTTPNIFVAAQYMLPYAVPYDSLGNRIVLPGNDVSIQNPIYEDRLTLNERKIIRTLGTLYAEIEPVKGLKYRMNFGPDFYNLQNGRYWDGQSINKSAGSTAGTNQASLAQTNRISWTLDNLVYYDKTIEKHNFGVTLLQSASANRTESSSISAPSVSTSAQKWYQLNTSANLTASSNLTETKLESYMARVNYGFDSKYLFTASARWDGASQLADGHKWDFFPSASLAWRMDQEDFIRSIKWIKTLKVRLGVGVTGNAAVDAYATKGAPQQGTNYLFGNDVAVGYVPSNLYAQTPTTMANQSLGWEKTKQWNMGVDFDVLKGRITGSIDLYTTKTTDLLLKMSILSLTGYQSTYGNVGATSNKGVDLNLTSVNVRTKDFTWTTNLSISATKSKIDQLNNGLKKDITNGWFVGERIGSYYDYVKVGIYQNTKADQDLIATYKAKSSGLAISPGTIKIKDLNNDTLLDANDRTIVGHANPTWSGGMTNTFSYKNFDLSIFIFSRLGFTVLTGQEFLQGRYAQRKVNYWTPNNPTNDYPSPNYSMSAGDNFKSSMNYQSGSFVKIRNIALGYTLPKATVNRLHLTNCKVYAQVTNPGFIYSKVSWIDPDTGLATFNRGFVLGVNVGL